MILPVQGLFSLDTEDALRAGIDGGMSTRQIASKLNIPKNIIRNEFAGIQMHYLVIQLHLLLHKVLVYAGWGIPSDTWSLIVRNHLTQYARNVKNFKCDLFFQRYREELSVRKC